MKSAVEITEYVQQAATQIGFVREHYAEADLPTNISNITILPFFGDLRSQFILSSLLLYRYLSDVKPNRYFILCSYPGLAGLFPYVDEFWGVADQALVTELTEKTVGFDSTSEKALFLRQSLREYFRDLVSWGPDFSKYYEDGLTKGFFDTFGKVHLYLPPLHSLKMDLNRQIAVAAGYKVFVHPQKTIQSWQGVYQTIRTDRQFWKQLYVRLLEAGITPVVWQTQNCHDLSAEFGGKCIFFNDKQILDVLAVMRACQCVLDVHSGVKYLATVARTPFLAVTERNQFVGFKEYELDDLCILNKSYQYIFSFGTVLSSSGYSSLVDSILMKLNDLLPTISRDNWPTTSEYTAVVPYSVVRKRKSKRIGARFIKVPRI